MTNLILVRHGQSVWNEQNKFTGWVDAGLSVKGQHEARFAGTLISKLDFQLHYTYASYLKRAIDTLNLIKNELGNNSLDLSTAWQLNERHYGSLTGLNKDETKKLIGESLFLKYRRSWDIAPPNIDLNQFDSSLLGLLYKKIPVDKVPLTESLKTTYQRVIPYYLNEIKPKIEAKKNVLISAHGNSIRALCKFLFNISDKKINELEIPTGNPMLIKIYRESKDIQGYYLDESRSNKIFFDE